MLLHLTKAYVPMERHWRCDPRAGHGKMSMWYTSILFHLIHIPLPTAAKISGHACFGKLILLQSFYSRRDILLRDRRTEIITHFPLAVLELLLP